MNFYHKKLKSIKGDASFRKFYRKKSYNKSSIVVYSDRERQKNLLIYDSINKLLIKNNVIAPKLYHQNYKKNYIEIEDFGSTSVFDKLKKFKKHKKELKFFKKIIYLLLKIQKIKQKKIKTFLNRNYKIENYSKDKLLKETNLFLKYYIPKVIKKKIEKN